MAEQCGGVTNPVIVVIRSAGHVLHNSLSLESGAGLLDGFGGTNMLDLALDVRLDDDVEGCVGWGGREVEGGDEGREGGEPAGERGGGSGSVGGSGRVLGRNNIITRRRTSALRMSGEHHYGGVGGGYMRA